MPILIKCTNCGRIIAEQQDSNENTKIQRIPKCQSCLDFDKRNILEGR